MPNYDYMCFAHDHVHEIHCSIANKPERVPCPECGEPARSVIISTPPTLSVIVPSYPGCLKRKAGYIHSHGDRPGTKIQVGAGGMIAHREKPTEDAILAQPMWHNPIGD